MDIKEALDGLRGSGVPPESWPIVVAAVVEARVMLAPFRSLATKSCYAVFDCRPFSLQLIHKVARCIFDCHNKGVYGAPGGFRDE